METRGWIEYFTDDSYTPYYYNKETKLTQWEIPEEMEYYNYGKKDKIEQKEQTQYPEDISQIGNWFQRIGVDRISSLKYDSIRRLHSFHIQTLDLLNWNDIALQNNGTLLFVICSQFYNCHSSFEELVACIEEILLFYSTVDVTLAILLDSHFGGGEKCISCLSYLLHSCNTEGNLEVRTICDLYIQLCTFLPFNKSFVIECQELLAQQPIQSVMISLVMHCQHHVEYFYQTIQACDTVSSLMVQLLNETSIECTFGVTLWQFMENLLKEKNDILYMSDTMVLIDILIRNIQNEDSKHQLMGVFLRILQKICNSTQYSNEMNEYKRREIDCLLRK